MKQGGPSKVGGRAAAVAKQTRSSLAWKASENRSALSSSELGYHIKIIHLLSHASYHHQSLAVMLWWRIAGNQMIGAGVGEWLQR